MTGELLTAEVVRESVLRVAHRAEVYADELNALDGALGDGDLGVTLTRGFRAVTEQLADLWSSDIGVFLEAAARAFVSTSGSTFGTLLATGLLSAAKSTQGRDAVPWSELPGLLSSAGAAMAKRGKAEVGDKTVLDMIDAVSAAMAGIGEPRAMLAAADQAASEALERFRDRPCRQGRARIFGENSIGRDDPGMVAFKRMLESLDRKAD